MFLALRFLALILHGFVINIGRAFMFFLKCSLSYTRVAKPSTSLTFTLKLACFSRSGTHVFHNVRDMFRCILLLRVFILWCSNAGVILVYSWHQNLCFCNTFSDDFLACFLTPFGIPKCFFRGAKNHQKHNYQTCFLTWFGISKVYVWKATGRPQGSSYVIVGELLHVFSIVFCCIVTSAEESGSGEG